MQNELGNVRILVCIFTVVNHGGTLFIFITTNIIFQEMSYTSTRWKHGLRITTRDICAQREQQTDVCQQNVPAVYHLDSNVINLVLLVH
jgi:hypothetical protein